MKCKVIINACAPAFLSRAEEIALFLQTHGPFINSRATAEEAVVFFADDHLKEKIILSLPFRVIHLVKIKHYHPELMLDILTELASKSPADIYIFPGDFSGNELVVRFAWRCKGSSLVAVENITMANDQFSATKKVYSGNLRGTFLFKAKPYCISLAKGMNRLSLAIPEEEKKVTLHDYYPKSGRSLMTEYGSAAAPQEEGGRLEKADLVIAAGRGTGSKEEISRLKNIARELGAELGVSRPVVMNGWAPIDSLIGASGSLVAPEICLVLAVSGSPPFYYGIEKSKTIIAVNQDHDAPIIKTADLVIIDDYKEIIKALLRVVRTNRSG